jgi:hypothetical protein
MNYALTISDHKITGVHQSMNEITGRTFERTPWLAGHEVRVVDGLGEYQSGVDIRCYEPDGTRKDPVWCITEGYMEMPSGHEIIDGELVEKSVTESDAPPTLLDRIIKAEIMAENSRAEEAQAVRTIFRELTRSRTLSDAAVLENRTMFEPWLPGLPVLKDAVYTYGDGLYRVVQAHTTQADWQPDNALNLFTRIAAPDEIPDWSAGSWSLGAVVRHKTLTWQSMVPNNVWEPGAPGVYDNIWKQSAGGN